MCGFSLLPIKPATSDGEEAESTPNFDFYLAPLKLKSIVGFQLD